MLLDCQRKVRTVTAMRYDTNPMSLTNGVLAHFMFGWVKEEDRWKVINMDRKDHLPCLIMNK